MRQRDRQSDELHRFDELGATTGLLNAPGGGYVAVEMVFIQFAGFTFGKSASAFATPWHGYPGNNNSFLMGGHDTVTGVNNIQYTAQFGNGVSATIGLDDPTVFNRTSVLNLGPSGLGVATIGALGPGANAYGGMQLRTSSVTSASIRLGVCSRFRPPRMSERFLQHPEHGCGSGWRVGVAAGASIALSEISGHPDTKWGGSVMAALQIKNIPTGAGDDFKIDASYAKGDTKNVISTSGASPSFAMFGGTGAAGAYQSIGFGVTTDAVFLPEFAAVDGTVKLTKAWGVRGAFNHNWDPYWSSSLWGSYARVRYSGDGWRSEHGQG